MEITFWNVNNKKSAIDIIAKSDFFSTKRLIAFAEYWEIDDYISTQLYGKNFWIDDVKKRTGYVHSNLNLKLKEAVRYYTQLSIEYNDIEIRTWIVHLKAQIDSEAVSDSINAHVIKGIIDDINSKGFKYSLIIGDFNISHFDHKILDFFHLNSTYYFNEEDPEAKIFDGYKRIKFYNPIGALHGDLSKGPPGTYYYNLPNQSQAWHTYDIALVSYSLSQYLDKEKCEIITELNGFNLSKNNGRPNPEISDHFPIRIKLV